MASPERLPELVRDSLLDTQFVSGITVHTYPGPRGDRQEVWKREKSIGSGGSGRVWLETCIDGHSQGPSQRAVKCVPIGASSEVISYSRELEALAKFSQRKYSDFFVGFSGWFKTSDWLCISLDYFPLGDLHDYLANHPKLSEQEAREITYQTLLGLRFMHHEGFAHRDLKPKNILISACPPDAWSVKLSDLGLSKRVDDEHGPNQVSGTEEFMAPELMYRPEEAATGPSEVPSENWFAADIWSLGHVAFQMLAGRNPFRDAGALFRYHEGRSKFPLELISDAGASEISAEFVNLIMVADPKDRIKVDAALAHEWTTIHREQRRPSLLAQYGCESLHGETATTVATNHRDRDTAEILSTPVKRDLTVRKSITRKPVGSSSQSPSRAPSDAGDTGSTRPLEDRRPSTNGDAESRKSDLAVRPVGVDSLYPCSSSSTSASSTSRVSELPPLQSSANTTPRTAQHDRAVEAINSEGSSVEAVQRIDFAGNEIQAVENIDFAGNDIQAVETIDLAGNDIQAVETIESTGNGLQTVEHIDAGNGATEISDALRLSITSQTQHCNRAVAIFEIMAKGNTTISEALHMGNFMHGRGAVSAIAFSFDRIATVSREEIQLCHMATKAVVARCALPPSLRNEDRVTSATFSRDSKWLATASNTGDVAIFDTTPLKFQFLSGHAAEVKSVAFSPDSHFVASASLDKTIRVWNTQDSKLVKTLKRPWGQREPILLAKFDGDGGVLGVFPNGTTYTWPEEGKRPETKKVVQLPNSQFEFVRATKGAFSQDSKCLALGSMRCAQVWTRTDESQGWDNSSEFSITTQGVVSLSFFPDAIRLAITFTDGTLQLWNVSSRLPIAILQGAKSSIQPVAVSPNSAWLASVRTDNEVAVWDMSTIATIDELKTHLDTASFVDKSPNHKWALSTPDNDATRHMPCLWDVENARIRGFLPRHGGRIVATAFSPNSDLVAIFSSNLIIRVWNAKTGSLVKMRTLHHRRDALSVSAATFSPDLSTLAVKEAHANQTEHGIALWDVERGLLRAHLGWYGNGYETARAFSPDSQRLAALFGSLAGSFVRVFDATTGTALYDLPVLVPFSGSVQLYDIFADLAHTVVSAASVGSHSVRFSPDGKQLAVSSTGNVMEFWDLETQRLDAKFHGGHVQPTATPVQPTISSDWKRLAIAAPDGKIHVWDVTTRQLVHSISDERYPNLLLFPEDSRMLLGVYSNKAIIWDTQSAGQSNTVVFSGIKARIRSAHFSMRHNRLISASENKLVQIWNCRTLALLKTYQGHDVSNGLPVSDTPKIRYHEAPTHVYR